MKAWTVLELNNVAGTLAALENLRLQEVQTRDQDVVLGFYSSTGMLWLWLDLNAISPVLLPWTALPFVLKNKKSPLQLFLRAHFVGRVLRAVRRPAGDDRVVVLSFDDAELEVRLYPHGRNIIARAEGKHVAWQRVKVDEGGAPAGAGVHLPLRGLEELRELWLANRGSKLKSPAKVRGTVESEIGKKEKALVKVQAELASKLEQPWRAVGDWLKQNQSLDVPKQWEPFVDKRRKLSWNIDQCYTRAREISGKIAGTEQRLKSLAAEIESLRQGLSRPPGERASARPTGIEKSGAHTRTLRISDEVTVMAGKSAVDNMKLLRRARSWDLWFHMRDYPSSHAILFRNKNTSISDAVLRQVAAWFVRLHLGAKVSQHAGEKFAILVTECRFVKPIKGDRIGRVTYRDERILIYQLPS